MPKVSVLMPVYNTREEWLREAIESILNQTFTDFEFLILDDGSTNNVADVIKSYSDKRIKYIYKENSGISDTLNLGISKAKGEYIARMDSDDISLPERFAKQIEYMDAHPEVGVLGTSIQVFGNKEELRFLQKNVGYLDMMRQSQVAHPAVIIRKSVMQNYNPEYEYAEDYELWSRLIKITKIENLPDALLRYRWSGENVSTQHAKTQAKSTARVKQNMLDFLSNNPLYQDAINDITHGKTRRRTVKLFGTLPLFLIKTKNSKTTWYLFNIIPFFQIKG